MTRRNALKRIVTLASAILAAGFGRSKAGPTDTRYWVPFATPCPGNDGYAPVGRYVAMQPQGNPHGICGVTVDGVDYRNFAIAGDDRAGWIVCREWRGYPTPVPPAAKVGCRAARYEWVPDEAVEWVNAEGDVERIESHRAVGVPYVVIRGVVRYQFDPARVTKPRDVDAKLAACTVNPLRDELSAAMDAADAGSSGRVRTMDGVTEFGIIPA
jgi:hypothetical protein